MYWHFKLDRFRATVRLIYNNETKLLKGPFTYAMVVWRFRPTMRFQWKILKSASPATATSLLACGNSS